MHESDLRDSDHWDDYERWRDNQPDAIKERKQKEIKNFKNGILIVILIILVLVGTSKCSSNGEGYTGNSERESN